MMASHDGPHAQASTSRRTSRSSGLTSGGRVTGGPPGVELDDCVRGCARVHHGGCCAVAERTWVVRRSPSCNTGVPPLRHDEQEDAAVVAVWVVGTGLVASFIRPAAGLPSAVWLSARVVGVFVPGLYPGPR